jgi:sortase A
MARLQKTLGRVLILMGALTFAYWGFLMLNRFQFQRTVSRMFQQQFEQASPATEQTGAQLAATIPVSHRGDIIGHLEIPHINLSVIVLEGSDSSILDVAAGHIQGTALPGTVGNIAIAAHRDTFFRSLQQIRVNDSVSVRTLAGVFKYQVESTEVVDPTDIEVLHQTTDEELTLVTCYPFGFIGAAPKRFIVHARKVRPFLYNEN